MELIWDQMWRASTNYGRKGLTIQCISALDIALWDALGKLRNEPVFNLLGGRTKVRMCGRVVVCVFICMCVYLCMCACAVLR